MRWWMLIKLTVMSILKHTHILNIILYTNVYLCMCSVAKSCLTLWDPMDCSLPSSSVHGIFQARILEWIAISSSRGSSWLRVWTHVSCISCTGRRILYHWAAREAPWYTNMINSIMLFIVQLLSLVWLCDPRTLGFPVQHYLPVCSSSCPLS